MARWSSLRRLIADPLGLLGLVLVVLIVLAAALSPWISPYDPNHISIMERLKPPSAAHWLGTDQLGRDLLSRVLVGSRIALLVAAVTIGVSLVGGIVLGLLAGYGPRWLDAILVLLFDSIRSFPTVMFGLAVVTILGPSLNTIMVIIIVFSVPGYARIVRTQTMSLKGTEFVMAERSLGAGMVRVLAVHILPNLIGPLLILASMDIPSVITIEAGLSFLGLGVRAPLASWGSILNDGYSFIRDTDWLVISAGVPLILATLGFTFLGESLRDIFDPRLRKDL
ncbi:MAG: peptide/nickel transport system permease protein [Rhodospirillaceae bacterium]|nr:peptide/nickel transport system permease protein [Rhodospirillaceae bacterium]